MTTTDRAHARDSNQQAAHYTELWIIGTPAEVTHLYQTLRRSGRLVYASAQGRRASQDR